MKLKQIDISAVGAARDFIAKQLPFAQDEIEWSWRDYQSSLTDSSSEERRPLAHARWVQACHTLGELHGVAKQLERLQYELTRELGKGEAEQI